MAKYVDGFVLVVRSDKIEEYKKMATMGKKVWMKYGALQYMECVADDIESEMPGMKPYFPKMTKLKPGETVAFSFIIFKSRKHRDQVNAKVMKDPFMNNPEMMKQPMPFDMKRMAYGGFQVLVEG